jgi:predicted transcriptional regulator
LARAGRTHRQIAEEIGVNERTVRRYLADAAEAARHSGIRLVSP